VRRGGRKGGTKTESAIQKARWDKSRQRTKEEKKRSSWGFFCSRRDLAERDGLGQDQGLVSAQQDPSWRGSWPS